MTGGISIGGGSRKAGYVGENGDIEYVDIQNPFPIREYSFISVENTFAETLDPDEEFTGEWVEILQFSAIIIAVKSNVASATDGLIVEFGPDEATVINSDEFTIPADKGKTFSFQPAGQYMRVRYINGGTIQNSFNLETQLKSDYVKPSSHRIKDPIISDDDAELVTSVIKVQTNDEETYKNVDVQNPLPTDGDSVYGKDLYLTECDPGDFIITNDSGASTAEILTSMVSDVWVEKKDDSATNPKIVTLAFRRPVLTTSFGIDSGPSGDFSNVKIYGKQGQFEFLIVDESSDDTKHQIKLFSTGPLKFSEIRFEFHTTDTVTTGLYGIFKHTEVAARLQALSEITDEVEDITSYRKVLNVNNAWVYRKIVNETFHQHTGDTTTPSSPISEGDITINFTSVTGFAEGSEIKLREGSTQEIGLMTITDITALVVTIDRPVGNDYTTAAEIDEVISNMAVSGTLASPEIFEIDPPPLTVWQFTRVLFSITDNLAPDDGKFGGIPALINGVSLRATTAAGRVVVFANWKNNGDMKLDMYDVIYTDKAPAGNHGVHGRWTFTKAEVVAEIDGDASPVQKLEILIQDDLTDLITFIMRGQGRVFSP